MGEKSSAAERGNSLESLQWCWFEVGITEAPPLFVLLGWVVSRGGVQTSCCIDDEEDVQRGRQRSDSHGAPGSEPAHFLPRPAEHRDAFVCAHTRVRACLLM